MGKKEQRKRPNAQKGTVQTHQKRPTDKKGSSDTLQTRKRRSNKPVKTVAETSVKTKLRLQIEYVPIDKVIPFSGNPRRNDDSVDAVVRSIEAFGYTNPILVRRADNIIIAGHTRLKAMQKLGEKTVPVVFLDLNEVDARVYGVFDNKSVELADWDGLKLVDLFTEFDQINVDLSLTGFTPDEIRDIVEGPGLDENHIPGDSDDKGIIELVFRLTEKQADNVKRIVNRAVEEGHGGHSENPHKIGNALHYLLTKCISSKSKHDRH